MKFSEEATSYGEDYVKILADAIANSVDSIIKDKNRFTRVGWDKNEPGESRHILSDMYQELKAVAGADEQKISELNAKMADTVDFISKLYDAKIDIYRTAEAVDLYMKSFAEGIAAHPNDLQDLAHILSRTEITAQWFTEKSGDFLCQVFDMFPSVYTNDTPVMSLLNETYNNLPEHYYLKVAGVCRLGDFAKIKNDAKNAGFIKTTVMNWADWKRDRNLSAAVGPTIGGPDICLPGNPFLGISVYENGAVLMKNMSKALSVSALKNIMAMFVNIGKKFGNKEVETFMSPIQIYKSLLNYISCSSLTFGAVHDDKNAAIPANDTWEVKFDDLDMDLPTAFANDKTLRDKNTMRLGLSGNAMIGALGVNKPNEKRRSYTTLRGIGNLRLGKLLDIFTESDAIFTMILKSVVAKVLTTIGVYNMFNKPLNKNGLGYPTNLRLILGGDEISKIIPEALELYVRLPLFVELYREIFKFDELSGEGYREISMIPEFDGVFSGLFNLIFDKVKYVKHGDYSSTDINLIINEVNKIYMKFSGQKNLLNNVYQELVSDVNRRYGVIKRAERVRFIQERKTRYDTMSEPQEDITDFELSGLDENDDYNRPGPSQSYQINNGVSRLRADNHKYSLSLGTTGSDLFYVQQLRNDLDNIFKEAKLILKETDTPTEQMNNIRTKISFSSMIEARAEELKYAKDEKEKFNIVHNAINSLGQFAVSALEKNLIMFQESVVFPLNTIHASYIGLKAFETRIEGMYNCLRAIGVDGEDSHSDRLLVAGNIRDFAPVAGLNFANDFQRNNIIPYMNAADGLLATVDDVAVKSGRQGTSVNITYAQLSAAVQGQDTEIAKNIVKRFIIDQGKLFISLFETLFSHKNAYGVEVKMDVQKSNNEKKTCSISCYVDHSKIFQELNDSFNLVKQNLDKFRGLISKDILKRYEDRSTAGSIYWLEKNLIMELIQGKQLEGDSNNYKPMDVVNNRIKKVLDYLTQEWKINARGLDVNIPNPYILQELDAAGIPRNATGSSYHEFDREIARLVYYDSFELNNTFSIVSEGYDNLLKYSRPANQSINGGPNAVVPSRSSDSLENLLFNMSGKVKNGKAVEDPWDGVPKYRDNRLYEGVKDGKMIYDDNRRSVFILFNRLVAAYLSQAYDYTTKKIYISTINSFANGAFSAAVMGDKNYSDDIIAPINNIMGTEKHKGVLAKTLAVMLRQLLTEMDDRNVKKQFLESDLNEIPLFVKERYRANFPIFRKMFSMLIAKCESLKITLRALNIEQRIDLSTVAAREGIRSANQLSRETNEKNLLAVLDNIIQGCVAINQCIKETLNEVITDSKYLETYQGSISIYENENRKTPFMPLSSTAYYLKNTDNSGNVIGDVQAPMMPQYELGDNRFKMLYGTRKIFNADSGIEDMPGMKDILKQHNNSSDQSHHIDEKSFGQLVKNITKLTENCASLKHYTVYFNNLNLSAESSVIGIAAVAAVAAIPARPAIVFDKNRIASSHAFVDFIGVGRIEKLVCYQLMSNVQLIDIMALTESSSQKEQKNKIVNAINNESLESCPNVITRRAMLAFNVIDLNIVPIKLQALMREMPLINLMNYACTFDHMISDLFGVKNENLLKNARDGNLINIDNLLENNEREPAKKLFGLLTIYPYANIDYKVYENFVSAIIRGSMGIEGLGRPKYIGDEVYNKALFGEIYPGQVYVEEMGPGAGVAHLRGKQEVLADLTREIVGPDYRDFAMNFTSALLINLNGIQGLQGIIPNNAVLDPAITLVVNRLIDANGNPLAVNFAALHAELVRPGVAAVLAPPAAAIPGGILDLVPRKELIASIVILCVHLFNLKNFKEVITRNIRQLLANNPGSPTQLVMTEYDNSILFTTFVNMLGSITNNTIQFAPPNVGPLVPVTVSTTLHTLLPYIQNDDLIKHFTNLLNSDNRLPLDTTGPNALIAGTIPMDAIPNTRRAPILQNLFRMIVGKAYNRLSRNTTNNIESANPNYFPDSLHYLEKNATLKEVALQNKGYKQYLQLLGKMRFDTNLVRNLFWITNIQRALRLKLRRDLNWYDGIIVKDLAVAAPNITESFGNKNSRHYEDEL